MTGLSVKVSRRRSAATPSQAPGLLGSMAAHASISTLGSRATTSHTAAACSRVEGMPRSSGFLGTMLSCRNGSSAVLVVAVNSGMTAPVVSA